MKRDTFKEFVLDQLAGLPDLECRRMFGGYGLFQGSAFFGILFKSRLYFKTDEQSRMKFKDRGSKPFKPSARQTLKTYYEVPAEILEDHKALNAWARESSLVSVRRIEKIRTKR